MARRKTTVIIEPEDGSEEQAPQKSRRGSVQQNTIASVGDLVELQDLIQEAADQSANVKISVHREDRSGTQTAYKFLEDLPGCPGSYGEIGERHGGGRYRLYARWKIPNASSWHSVTHNFCLDARFDAIARANAAQPFDGTVAPAPVAAPVVRAVQVEPPRDRMSDMLTMVQAIVGAIAPLLKPQRDPMEMISMIAGLGQQVFKSQVEHAEDYSRRIMDMAEARVGVEQEPDLQHAVEEVAPKDPIMAMMLEALKTIVPMFRRAPEQEAKAAAAPLAQRPDVRGLIGNIHRRRRMMVELRKEYTEQEVARLCRIFNVPYQAPVEPSAARPVAQQTGEEAEEDRRTASSDDQQSVRFVQEDLFRGPTAPGADPDAADQDGARAG